MKKLSLTQMENLEGGKLSSCGYAANVSIASIGLVASVGACFGPIGLAIAGPTALGMGVFGLVCSIAG